MHFVLTADTVGLSYSLSFGNGKGNNSPLSQSLSQISSFQLRKKQVQLNRENNKHFKNFFTCRCSYSVVYYSNNNNNLLHELKQYVFKLSKPCQLTRRISLSIRRVSLFSLKHNQVIFYIDISMWEAAILISIF